MSDFLAITDTDGVEILVSRAALAAVEPLFNDAKAMKRLGYLVHLAIPLVDDVSPRTHIKVTVAEGARLWTELLGSPGKEEM